MPANIESWGLKEIATVATGCREPTQRGVLRCLAGGEGWRGDDLHCDGQVVLPALTYCTTTAVERLFTVRGQSYLSRLPKYWPPILLSARRVCSSPPLCWGGEEHTRQGYRGMGGRYSGRRERLDCPLTVNNLSTTTAFTAKELLSCWILAIPAAVADASILLNVHKTPTSAKSGKEGRGAGTLGTVWQLPGDYSTQKEARRTRGIVYLCTSWLTSCCDHTTEESNFIALLSHIHI